jgi:dTDP-4-dehydrorhamnose reductase
LEKFKPWAVINTIEFNQLDNAELEPATCFRINTYGAAMVAEACGCLGIPLLSFSTDHVFNGDAGEPYLESSRVNPLNVFGRSKAEAERQIMQAHKGALVIRSGPHICPWDEDNFLTVALRNLEESLPIVATDERLFSPVYVPDLVNTSLDLLLDAESGIWHLANVGAVTFADLAWSAAQTAGLDTNLIEIKHAYTLHGFSAPQPQYSVLSSERGVLLPTLEKALEAYCTQLKQVEALI